MSANSNNREEQTRSPTISTTAPTNPVVATTQVSITPSLGSTIAPTHSETQLLSQTTQQPPFSVRNGSARSRGLVHSVSIIVEPAMADGDDGDSFPADQRPIPSVSNERRNTIAGPYVVLEDFGFGEFINFFTIEIFIKMSLKSHTLVIFALKFAKISWYFTKSFL